MASKVRIIDLFSGAGGFTEGFREHFRDRFETVWANDFNRFAARTYNANFGNHCIDGDIVDLIEQGVPIPEADVVIGGPPCQGFSLLNKNRAEDPRRLLWIPYLDIVAQSKAKVFVIENVRTLLGTPEHYAIEAKAREMGFQLASTVLCAADYGVPQSRYRAFIVGSRGNNPADFFPPKRTHYNPADRKKPNLLDYVADPQPYVTVQSAIGDLPAPHGVDIRKVPPPLDIHFGRTPTALSIERYRIVSEEGMNRFDLQRLAPDLTPACWIRKKSGGTDLFGRLWWDRPAFTIRTEFFKPEKGRYLHPSEHRPITHREAARLQSFPDSFVFLGTKIEIARQIGNAVPPLLAKHVAASVDSILEDGDW